MGRFTAKMVPNGWAVFDGGVQVTTVVDSKLSARRKAASLNRRMEQSHGR